MVAGVLPVSAHQHRWGCLGLPKYCPTCLHSFALPRVIAWPKQVFNSNGNATPDWLLSHSWLTQSQDHLQTGKKKGREFGWFYLCPQIPMTLCLLLHFVTQSHLGKCYNKGAVMPWSSYFCVTGLWCGSEAVLLGTLWLLSQFSCYMDDSFKETRTPCSQECLLRCSLEDKSNGFTHLWVHWLYHRKWKE